MKTKRYILAFAFIFFFILIGTTPCRATEYEEESLPGEYGDFISNLPDYVIDALPDTALDDNKSSLYEAADELSRPTSVLSAILRGFGSQISNVLPTLAKLLGIIIISSLSYSLSSSLGEGIGKAMTIVTRLACYVAVCSITFSTLGDLKDYFNSLFSAVGSFVPLSAVLYAMGGNLTSAVSEASGISITLAVCEFICTKTTIPLFCLCLSLTLISMLEGGGGVGVSLSNDIKKWYLTSISFVMLVLTTSLASQNILSARADGVAMRGTKLALSSFVPLSGGTLSSTLGTLSSSVGLLRGSVGIIGIAVIILMLMPTIMYLSLLRLCFSFCSTLCGLLSCTGEQKLFSELNNLYGYLIGISALSAAVFVIALAIFAKTATPFG